MCSSVLFSQEEQTDEITIAQLLAAERYEQADAVLQRRLLQYKNNGNLDSLANMPYYIGNVQLHLSDAATAVQRAQQLVDELESLHASPRQLYEASLSMVYFLDEIGQVQRSYEVTQQALAYAQQSDDTTPEEIGYLAYNLGASALQMGNFDLASAHFREAMDQYTSYPATDEQKIADAYNAMGAIMWFSTKLDSARFYYGKSLQTVEKMEVDELQKKYLTAVTLANIALIQQAQGQTDQAIQTLKQTLANYHEVILHTDDDSQRNKTVRFQWRSMSNLAAFYNDVGNYKAAHNLLDYVYKSQQQELQPEDPELYKTGIKVGQSLMSLKEYPSAATILAKAIDAMAGSGGEHLYWKAIALFALAETAEQLGDIAAASDHYEGSEAAFKNAQSTGYNKDYLHFLRKKALFYAQHHGTQRAVETALDGYHYVIRTAGDDNALVFNHLLNLAEVHFRLGEYEKSLQYGEQSIQQLENRAATGNLLDSIQANFQKPMAILVRCQSAYHLGDRQDVSFLKGLYADLQEALATLEWQKAMFTSAENISALIENNSSLFDFAKQIGMDLYKNTGNPEYLNEVIGFHESSLYNKIRLRFNLRNTRFFDVPDPVLQEEIALRNELNQAFTDGSATGDMEQIGLFPERMAAWNSFLADLQQSYPRYYNMRYGILSESIADVISQVDDDRTIIRYFFVDSTLYASVITATSAELFPLDYPPIAKHIARSMRNDLRPTELDTFHELYQQLWMPFAQQVRTKHVTIIPDRELFNLNFETLLTQPATSPEDFATASLLHKHVISYRFSLLMLPQEHNTPFERDYTAFAPGFFDGMKADYQRSADDAEAIDDGYLTLLAQPFMTDLVKTLRKHYKGNPFLGNRATAAQFKANAYGSKILHIGTHAESDNVSPDFSRIIFAKDIDGTGVDNENALYAYELYGYDLSSNLTVLAACETGKPGYQPGEGMVSLAHAFSYAGSQSLLTALWQVDEETSAQVLGQFYDYLAQGLPKAEALQQAKLAYLQHAEGRAAMPQYWAGLVLVGDTAPIQLEPRHGHHLWIAATSGLLLLFSIGLFVRRKSRP